MLEVVDPKVDSLAVGHRAEMASDLDTTSMRFINHGFELGAVDVGVCLDPRRALLDPVVYEAAGLLWRYEPLADRHVGRFRRTRDVG